MRNSHKATIILPQYFAYSQKCMKQLYQNYSQKLIKYLCLLNRRKCIIFDCNYEYKH